MDNFEIEWEKKEKYNSPIRRKTIVKASSENAAKALIYKEFGNSKKVIIHSVKAITQEKNES